MRVRDICQYQIKTMSIDWKIIIVKPGNGADVPVPVAADNAIKQQKSADSFCNGRP